MAKVYVLYSLTSSMPYESPTFSVNSFFFFFKVNDDMTTGLLMALISQAVLKAAWFYILASVVRSLSFYTMVQKLN